MPYKDKEKRHEHNVRYGRERYARLKDDPEYKQANHDRSARWRAADPERVRQSRKLSRRKTTYNYLDLDHYKWEDVEGYDGWTINTEVHHRREGIGYSVAQLKEQGQYYNCRADELICVTNAEHKRIHNEIDKFFRRGNYKRKEDK